MKARVIRGSKVLVVSSVAMIVAPGACAALETQAKDEPAALVALRDELVQKKREEVTGSRVALARYRPLCDKDGYPLVGNVTQKVIPGYQPSEFCAEVRKTLKRP